MGDEGGFAPNLASTDEAISFLLTATEKAGYRPGEDVYLALDSASTEFYVNGKYEMKGEGLSLSSDELVAKYVDLCSRYPIISIEDGMAEDERERGEDAVRAAHCPTPTGKTSPE